MDKAMWRLALAPLAVVAALIAAGPASAAVVINEVESDAPAGGADWIELMNTGASEIDLGGYKLKDNDDGHVDTIPAGTKIAAGGFLAFDTGFGLGGNDAARLFSPADALLDSYSWTSSANTTYGRCPDGTGAMVNTASSTRGAANDCPSAPLPSVAWPGSADTAVADDLAVFGANLSGLAYQPSGTSAKGVLWAVRNSPSTLFKLVYQGGRWTPADGWASGKQLVYPDGGGVPDAEGVTLAGGDANGIYVSTERNDAGGALSNTSRPAVLRYDVTAAGNTLTATNDWNMTADLPGLGANLGLEAVTWVPDTLLASKGFYNPAAYPGHGDGLFFVGVEQDGAIYAYALNRAGDAYTRVAKIKSSFPAVMDLTYEPESTHLWAACDNTCDGKTAILDVSGPGTFAVTKVFDRPANMANLNNEGFAIAPQAECVGGLKPTFYADDSATAGHSLRSGQINCTPLSVDPGPTPTPTPEATVTPQPQPTVAPTPQPTPQPADKRAPKLVLSFKADRKKRTLSPTITLDEQATLTITVKAGKKTLLKTTRSGAARKTTLKLRSKSALKKGQKLTVTVVARDAAGNTTTRTLSAKVR